MLLYRASLITSNMPYFLCTELHSVSLHYLNIIFKNSTAIKYYLSSLLHFSYITDICTKVLFFSCLQDDA